MVNRTAIMAAALMMSSFTAAAEQSRITTSANRPQIKGAPENFIGHVRVSPWYPANEHTTSTGGLVEFEAGARSAWHTHPAGQTLVIMSGTGWVQEEGGEKREIKPGDVVWTPPGVKHWHGASDAEAMSHIAITNMKDGSNVAWMEHVTDDQYLD